MERRERIFHLLRSAETNAALAVQSMEHGEQRMVDVRRFAKEAKAKLKQAMEAIDGID